MNTASSVYSAGNVIRIAARTGGPPPNRPRNYLAIAIVVAVCAVLVTGAALLAKKMYYEISATVSDLLIEPERPFTVYAGTGKNRIAYVAVPSYSYRPESYITPMDELFQREADFDIPAGLLAQQLEQLGPDVPFFRYGDLKGVRGPGVTGRLKFGLAIDALLKGTGCKKSVTRNEVYQVYCKVEAVLTPKTGVKAPSHAGR